MSSLSTSWIGPVVVALVVPFVLRLFLRGTKPAATQKEGKRWLEYGKPLKAFSIIILMIPTALFVGVFFADSQSQSAIFSIGLLFLGLGLPLFMEFFGVKIGFDENSIYCYSPWVKNRIVVWDEIEEIEFSESMQWWVIKTRNKGKIRLHVFLSGIPTILEEIKNKMAAEQSSGKGREDSL